MDFNWCFIGAGNIARRVAKELVTNQGHHIVSIYNRTKEKAISFGKTYSSRVYDTALEAIKDERVNAVYIATNNNTHYQYIKLCLENHVPVLCEKPLTGNSKELKELIGLANKENTYLCEAMWTWFNPVSLKVKEWIKNNEIGKILSVDARFTAPILSYRKKNSRLSNLDSYGGALLDLGVYPIRYVYELFGKPLSITSKGKLFRGCDKSNESIFKYDGFEAKIISRIDLFVGEYVKIIGEKGYIKVPFFHRSGKAILKNDNGRLVIKDKSLKYAKQFRTVAEDVSKNKKERISLKSSLEVIEMMDEIRKQIGVRYSCD